MLDGRYIRVKHRCKKLEDMKLGPFNVLSEGSNLHYCKLKLTELWKIHPVFNIDLLEWYWGTNPKEQIIEVEVDRDYWALESIVASGPLDQYVKRHMYWVIWKEFLHKENMCETFENAVDIDSKLLEEYYKRNPMVEWDGRFRPKNKARKKSTAKECKWVWLLILNLFCQNILIFII